MFSVASLVGKLEQEVGLVVQVYHQSHLIHEVHPYPWCHLVTYGWLGKARMNEVGVLLAEVHCKIVLVKMLGSVYIRSHSWHDLVFPLLLHEAKDKRRITKPLGLGYRCGASGLLPRESCWYLLYCWMVGKSHGYCKDDMFGFILGWRTSSCRDIWLAWQHQSNVCSFWKNLLSMDSCIICTQSIIKHTVAGFCTAVKIVFYLPFSYCVALPFLSHRQGKKEFLITAKHCKIKSLGNQLISTLWTTWHLYYFAFVLATVSCCKNLFMSKICHANYCINKTCASHNIMWICTADCHTIGTLYWSYVCTKSNNIRNTSIPQWQSNNSMRDQLIWNTNISLIDCWFFCK